MYFRADCDSAGRVRHGRAPHRRGVSCLSFAAAPRRVTRAVALPQVPGRQGDLHAEPNLGQPHTHLPVSASPVAPPPTRRSDSGVVAKQYRYYDKKTCGLDFAGLLDDLNVRCAAAMSHRSSARRMPPRAAPCCCTRARTTRPASTSARHVAGRARPPHAAAVAMEGAERAAKEAPSAAVHRHGVPGLCHGRW